MPEDSNQNLVFETSNNDSNALGAKFLTFKDWKILKDSETRSKIVTKHTQVKNVNIKNSKGQTSFASPLHYNGILNSFNAVNNFIGRGNVFGNGNNTYNATNNTGFTNYNRQNNFLNNNNLSPKNFDCSPNGRNFQNYFFASDGIYRQRDLMQKSLPPNTFNQDERSRTLLQEFEKNCERKKKISVNRQNDLKMSSSPANSKTSTINTKAFKEHKVYVPNPNASKDGKAFIPKPKIPEENLQISKEEKKQQWKEYREAMKPFKNREFYNAKRVVQRLGKKNPSELNEKELFRLANAREVMAAHKARLTAKYSSYVKAEGKTNDLGEVYVLKKHPTKEWEVRKGIPKENQNYVESQRNDIESGRKILGGCGSFNGFVPGGIVEGTSQRMQQKLSV